MPRSFDVHRSPVVLLCLSLAFTLLGSAPAAAECNVSSLFAPSVEVPSRARPHDFVVHDFDEDGFLDVAITGWTEGMVSIHYGLGDGTFGGMISEPCGAGALGLAMADFNHDGIEDLAVTNNAGGSVSILLGLGSLGVGNGRFGPPQSFSTGGSGPFLVATGDFNEDGIADLVVPNNHSNSIAVLLGNGTAGIGDGTMGPPTLHATDYYPTTPVLGDFNSDGIADFACTIHGDDHVQIFYGLGSGGVGNGAFAAGPEYWTDINPFHMAAGDLNQDGITDLVTANSTSVSVLLGNGSGGMGNGTFAPATHYTYGTGGGTMAILDANHDGVTDLAVADALDEDVSILLGQTTAGVANGAFVEVANHPVGAYPIAVATGDFNQDGDTDLVVASWNDASFSLLLGRCLDPAATELDVRDVPDDDGGKVFVTWLASGLDNPTDHAITGYRVWRRVHPALAKSAPVGFEAQRDDWQIIQREGPDGTIEVTFWEALVTLPAEFLPGYGYTASTTQDSTRVSNRYTAFFVTALTANSTVFYPSAIDSGYSVDNRRPRRPRNVVVQGGGAGVSLQWEANPEEDLDHYRVYRGASEGFEPSEASLVGSPEEPSYVDGGGSAGAWYKVGAMDVHGNESDLAVAPPTQVLDVGSQPLELALERVSSRSGRVVVAFTLPLDEPGSLQLVDVGGRQIRSHSLQSLGRGRHEIDLVSGLQIRSGIYFVRLTQGARSVSAKAMVLR